MQFLAGATCAVAHGDFTSRDTKLRDKIARVILVLSRQKLMAKTLRYLDVHFSTKRHFIAADLQQSDVARLTDVNA